MNEDLLITIAPSIIFLVIVALAVIFVFKNSKREVKHTDDGGLSIPVIQGNYTLKSLPGISIGHNNLNPKLIFYGDKFKYQIFGMKSFQYFDLETVTVRRLFGIPLLRIFFRDSKIGCSFRIAREENVVIALNKFKEKRCPLSPEAEQELSKLSK